MKRLVGRRERSLTHAARAAALCALVLAVTLAAVPAALGAVEVFSLPLRFGVTTPGGRLSGVQANYNLYRGPAGQPPTQSDPPVATGLSSPNFADLPPSDGSYTYAVSAVDLAGNESALSTARCVVTCAAIRSSLCRVPPVGGQKNFFGTRDLRQSISRARKPPSTKNQPIWRKKVFYEIRPRFAPPPL